MNLYEEVKRIAYDKSVVDGPWGVGDDTLIGNGESWAPYLRFLFHTAALVKSPAIIECGVYMGTATRHMALGSPESLVVGIDRQFHPDVSAMTNLPNVKLIVGDTTKVDTAKDVRTVLDGKKVRLIFIDSTHDGITPQLEYQLYSQFFDDECVVVCDDLIGPRHLAEQMDVFWEWLPGDKMLLHHLHPAAHTAMDTPGFGVSIVRR